MPSPSLLLHAHPALGWWTVLWCLAVGVLLLARRPVDGRAVAAWATGALAVATLAPPRGGLVPGLARTCDLRPEHLLWPTDWVRQDPRMGAVALMLLVGLAVASRPRWVAGAAATPVLIEVVQYAVPSLARACAVPDVLPALTALATGVAAGLLLRAGGRRVRAASFRAMVALTAGTVVVTTLGLWTLRAEPVVAAVARVELLGAQTFLADLARAGGPDLLERAGDVPLPGLGTAYEDMARTALRDLVLLTDGLEGDDGLLPAAGPAGSWGYFWPRDGAFVAVALARAGEPGRAARLLERVGELYLDPMYGFDARYLPSGERVTVDPRRAQVDGCGWVLWAIHETGRDRPGPEPEPVGDLRDRCTDQLLRATGGGSHLPAPGQDYWERATYEHLLGSSAPVAAGLRLAAADYGAAGEQERAGRAAAAAAGVRTQVDRHFGPGFLRAGTHGGLDAATAMLMPPFDPDPLPGVREAWLGYQQQAARPGGGLAPGSTWKRDGISWTPEVGLVAYTAAAAGEARTAHHWLGWLDAHRAPWGSLPEKVDGQGRPGGPAPLGWTSALVLLTLDLLGEGSDDTEPQGAPS